MSKCFDPEQGSRGISEAAYTPHLKSQESATLRPPRTPNSASSKITLDGTRFIPSTEPGIYMREGVSEAQHDRFIDFQIVLNEEELQVLMHRKKMMGRSDLRIEKSKSASRSFERGVPYIDSNRVEQTMYRSTQPEKWVNSEGMRPLKR
jgi:hypothetical protein